MLKFKSKNAQLTALWLVLVAATVLAWFLAQHGKGITREPGAATSILVIAFSKVALVMLFFMDVRWAPLALIIGAACWIISLCAVLTWLCAF